MNRPDRLALVDHADPALPVVAQCRLLKVSRSTLYHQPVPVSADDPAVMRRMDELYVASPFTARGAWWRYCAVRVSRSIANGCGD